MTWLWLPLRGNHILVQICCSVSLLRVVGSHGKGIHHVPLRKGWESAVVFCSLLLTFFPQSSTRLNYISSSPTSMTTTFSEPVSPWVRSVRFTTRSLKIWSENGHFTLLSHCNQWWSLIINDCYNNPWVLPSRLFCTHNVFLKLRRQLYLYRYCIRMVFHGSE